MTSALMPHSDAGALSVRSTVLSVLLGAHPEAIPPKRLIAAARHFDMPASSVRVALTRAVAAGDLCRRDGGYGLGERLLQRQQRQNAALAPSTRAWDGDWETAVVVASSGRPSNERAALRETLTRHRLAELREGVWLRPANLARSAAYDGDPALLTGRSRYDDPAQVVSRLWDLERWASDAVTIKRTFSGADAPSRRLVAAAHLVRHLMTDPILPADLLPPSWPADDLRATYATYQDELHQLAAESA